MFSKATEMERALMLLLLVVGIITTTVLYKSSEHIKSLNKEVIELTTRLDERDKEEHAYKELNYQRLGYKQIAEPTELSVLLEIRDTLRGAR
jgi:cell division protein FtsL